MLAFDFRQLSLESASHEFQKRQVPQFHGCLILGNRLFVTLVWQGHLLLRNGFGLHASVTCFPIQCLSLLARFAIQRTISQRGLADLRRLRIFQVPPALGWPKSDAAQTSPRTASDSPMLPAGPEWMLCPSTSLLCVCRPADSIAGWHVPALAGPSQARSTGFPRPPPPERASSWRRGSRAHLRSLDPACQHGFR
jgi:hypothetical protein